MKLFNIGLIAIVILLNGCKDNSTSVIISPPSGYALIDVEPTWSQDGKTIAYVHLDSSLSEAGIYIIDTSGENKRLLLNGNLANPDWSQDGEWILFTSGGQICKIKPNSDSLTQLTNEGSNFFPSWSFDGEWIAYDSNIEGRYYIWKMRKDGAGKIKIIYPDTANIGVRMPNWSTNKIVHLGYIKGSTGEPQICIMNENGANYQIITNNTMRKHLPKLTNDGLIIAFHVEESGPIFQIWSINSDGSNLKKLTNTQGYSPTWSPDNEWIAYTDSRPNNGRLWLMKKDGSFRHQLTY